MVIPADLQHIYTKVYGEYSVMIIKLFQSSTLGWLLIAEQLVDPPTWDRFLPNHSPESDRARFDNRAKAEAEGNIKIKSCKEMLKPGTSVFQYDWQVDEGDVLVHAMQVSEAVGCELVFAEPAIAGSSSSRTAA
jgi:hypothetical protein